MKSSPHAPAPHTPSERALLGAEATNWRDAMTAIRAARPDDPEALREKLIEVFTSSRTNARKVGRTSLAEELAPLGVRRNALAELHTSLSLGLVARPEDEEAAASIAKSLTDRWLAEERGTPMTDGSLVHHVDMASATETARAFNDERAVAFSEVRDPEIMMAWSAYLDAKVCPSCMAYDGDVVPPSVGFGVTPPLHPLCRCLIVPRRVVTDADGFVVDNGSRVRRIQR